MSRVPVFAAAIAILGSGCSGGPSAAVEAGASGARDGMDATGGAGAGGAGATVGDAAVDGALDRSAHGADGSAGGSGGRPGVGASGGASSGGGLDGSAGGVPVGDGGTLSSSIVLTAVRANASIGLDWTRVPGASGYRVYWSAAPAVMPQTAQVLTAVGPTAIHRGLTNGTQYHYVVTAIMAAGESPPSNEMAATPGGEWALEELGSGDFDSIVSGDRTPRLPIAKRVHVLLLAEGYLASELPVFHDHARHNLETPTNDVDRWMREIFALDPYSKFREAFVVWYLPRPSATHSDGGNSAFGTEASTAVGPLWAALDAAGPDAFPFPPVASSRNFVAAFLLFDPARGRAGVSGHSSSCRAPGGGPSLRCAFGIGHAHEFTHAFSEVRDEYLEDSNTTSGNVSEWSNVTPSNTCNTLPWAHLLPGRGINAADQLVGAFGRPGRGYHSEFKCQMNGTHDNGAHWCSGESLTLRVNRFCNFCRELTAFRILHRTELLPASTAEAFAMWKSTYRRPFFDRFGFAVPAPVPQTVTCGGGAASPVYEACAP